ncbi:LamG domain-containing protein [Candidatus Poribacteria bacterium]|nr:LamG domain-containing protein [Candidatus Poribacteria bacterium]
MPRMRHTVVACAVTYLLGVFAAGAAIDPATAVGVWLMDEGKGGDVPDSGAHKFTGTITGAKWTDGKFGKALEFDGKSWVSIPDAPELQCGKQLTMMAYFYAKDIGDWRQIIAKSDEYLLRIDPPGEGNRMSAFIKVAGNWEPRASAAVPSLKTWIHFAATYDEDAKGGVDHIKIYVDGVRAGQSTRAGKHPVTDKVVEIGRWGGGSYFVGIIDDAAIFNVALDEADIAKIAKEGLSAALRGGLSVDAKAKLATTWAEAKR